MTPNTNIYVPGHGWGRVVTHTTVRIYGCGWKPDYTISTQEGTK